MQRKEAMSFHFTKTVKFTEEIDYAKFVLFDRIFFVNGLKFLVVFGRTVENYPEIRMELIKGAEILNDPVIIDLGFVSSDCRGKFRFGSASKDFENYLPKLKVEKLKTGFYLLQKPEHYESMIPLEEFRKTHKTITTKSVTYTMTFHLELKKLEFVAPPEPQKMYEKLYLDQELSDVKILCKGKAIHCHKTVLR